MPAIEEKKVCLIFGCGKPPAYKGLCMKCYSEAKKLVEAKTTTWAALSELGLADLGESKFMKALKQKQQEQE